MFIKYFTVDSLQETIEERALYLVQTISKHFNTCNNFDPVKIYPEQSQCNNCGEALKAQVKTKNGTLLTKIIMNAEIYVHHCINESCKLYNVIISFQGTEFGYVNYKNNIIIPVERIKEYLDQFAANGTSFVAWWNSTYTPPSTKLSQLPLFAIKRKWESHVGYLHEAFVSVVDLMIFQESKLKCCDSPKVVAMDGTVISIKTSNMPKFEHPWVKETIASQSSKRVERQLPSLPKEKKDLLQKVINGSKLYQTTVNSWREDDLLSLKMLSYCCRFLHSNQYVIHEKAKLFASSILKKVCPASSLLPFECVELVLR